MATAKKTKNKGVQHFSPEDDAKIVKLVKAFPGNLKHAFEAADGALGRPHGASQGRWYRTLQHNEDVIALVTSEGKLPGNRKLTPRSPSSIGKSKKAKESLALDIARMALDRLTPEEKLFLAESILASDGREKTDKPKRTYRALLGPGKA